MVRDRLRVINIVLLGMGAPLHFIVRVRPPSTVAALLWGRRVVRCAYPCRWVWSLVLGKDRRGRVTTDTARAAAVFVVRRFVVRRFIGPPTFPLWALGFFFILVSGWRVRVCPSSCSCSCSDHLATVLILSREGSRARDTSWLGGGGGRPAGG